MEQEFGSERMVSEVIEKYADMVMRICCLCLGKKPDAEDVFQEVFLKFFIHADSLQTEEHRKAWLCRVAFNQCKDASKSMWRRKVVSLQGMEIRSQNPQESIVVDAVRALPHPYKQVIYLHFYEGKTVPEIARLLDENENTVYTRLRRAKEQLKKKVGEFQYDGATE